MPGRIAMTDFVPTGRELKALKVLWELGEATVRELYARFDAGSGTLPYTTVLSLMQLLEKKGLAGHRRRGKTYVYFPKIDRERTFQSLAGGLLDRVFDGAIDEYLAHALNSRRVSPAELARLERMIGEAKSKGRRKKSGEG